MTASTRAKGSSRGSRRRRPLNCKPPPRFLALAEHQVIDRALAERLAAAAGFRNLVAHRYGAIDIARLFAIASTDTADRETSSDVIITSSFLVPRVRRDGLRLAAAMPEKRANPVRWHVPTGCAVGQ